MFNKNDGQHNKSFFLFVFTARISLISQVYVISNRKGTLTILIDTSGFPAGGVAGDHRQGGGANHPGGDPADQGEEGQGGN